MIWTLQIYGFYFIHQRKSKEKFKNLIFIFAGYSNRKKYPVIGWITGYRNYINLNTFPCIPEKKKLNKNLIYMHFPYRLNHVL